MSAEWKELTLGDIAEEDGGSVDGPFGSNLKASSYTETGIPVIRGSNLSVGLDRFKSEEFVYVSNETLERLRRSECLPGDIIFTKKGTLGQTGIVPEGTSFENYLLSSNQMRLRVNSELADPEYAYYWVSSKDSIAKKNKILNSRVFQRLTWTIFESFLLSYLALIRKRKLVESTPKLVAVKNFRTDVFI